MFHHQNVEAFKLERASTDRYGSNPLNFSLFDLTGLEFAPRIPKMHNETLWRFGKHNDYSNLIISPDKTANTNYVIDNCDNMQRMIVSMLTGDAIPNVVIGKMSSDATITIGLITCESYFPGGGCSSSSFLVNLNSTHKCNH